MCSVCSVKYCTKGHTYLNKPVAKKLQVCLRMYDILTDTRADRKVPILADVNWPYLSITLMLNK